MNISLLLDHHEKCGGWLAPGTWGLHGGNVRASQATYGINLITGYRAIGQSDNDPENERVCM